MDFFENPAGLCLLHEFLSISFFNSFNSQPAQLSHNDLPFVLTERKVLYAIKMITHPRIIYIIIF